MKIEKADSGFRLLTGEKEFLLDTEAYEDLFYAIPVNSTAFYRLLTEQAAQTEEQRALIVDMLKSVPDMDATLNDLQEQIKNLPPA
jgi:hypothetical protein